MSHTYVFVCNVCVCVCVCVCTHALVIARQLFGQSLEDLKVANEWQSEGTSVNTHCKCEHYYTQHIRDGWPRASLHPRETWGSLGYSCVSRTNLADNLKS